MPRFKKYEKHIACLESLWDAEVENKLSVAPMLDLLSRLLEIKYTHLTCNTLTEFEFNLGKIPRKTKYRILYLGFHGSPGEIHMADGSKLSLEELADKMGSRFKDWIIHFGSCGTLADCDKKNERLTAFMQKTGVSLIIGYKLDVDWTESAALDMLILDWLQQYRNMKTFTEKVESLYPDLAGATGLCFFSG
jgi:hypothetical protein